jgi:hypothetical protein
MITSNGEYINNIIKLFRGLIDIYILSKYGNHPIFAANPL